MCACMSTLKGKRELSKGISRKINTISGRSREWFCLEIKVREKTTKEMVSTY